MKHMRVVVLLLVFLLGGCGYSGGYRIYVLGIQIPATKPNGSTWDASGELAKLLASDELGAVLTALQLLNPWSGAVAIANLIDLQSNKASRLLLGKLAELQGKTVAPDPVLVLNFHGLGTYRTPLVKDSHTAGWNAPALGVVGGGRRKVSLALWDRDIAFHDLVGQTEFRLRDLEKAGRGGPTSISFKNGAVVILEVERAFKEDGSPNVPKPRLTVDENTGQRVWSRLSFKADHNGGYTSKTLGLPPELQRGDLFDSARFGRCEIGSVEGGRLELKVLRSGETKWYSCVRLGGVQTPPRAEKPKPPTSSAGGANPTSQPTKR